MEIRTHLKVDQSVNGTPIWVEEGFSRVELTLTEAMSVDASGLIHGGYLFGLADYAAMIAVNHPNVVLAGAEIRFMRPVKAGDKVAAEAKIEESENRKHKVRVKVERGEIEVFGGVFLCYVPEKHVLSESSE